MITLLTAVLLQDDLEAKIEKLREADVGWRKIEWKSCLLEGVKEAREKKRPIVCWVFIDRPVDDERC